MAPTVCSDPEQFILPKFSPGDSNIVAVVHRTVEEHRIVLWNSDSQRVKTEFVIEGKTEISCISWGLIDVCSFSLCKLFGLNKTVDQFEYGRAECEQIASDCSRSREWNDSIVFRTTRSIMETFVVCKYVASNH